jgi:Flp pilus assembly protein TadG
VRQYKNAISDQKTIRQEGKTMLNWKIDFLTKRALRRSHLAAHMTRLLGTVASDAGSAIVEMALSCAILLSMFIGVYEVCLASYSSHFVAEAAREGARYAIVRGSLSCTNTPSLPNCGASTDTISNYVKSLQYPGIIPANLTVTVTYMKASSSTASGSLLTTWSACNSSTTTCNVPGNMVNVQVSYAFGLYVPFVPSNSLNIGSTSQMVVQQ